MVLLPGSPNNKAVTRIRWRHGGEVGKASRAQALVTRVGPLLSSESTSGAQNARLKPASSCC